MKGHSTPQSKRKFSAQTPLSTGKSKKKSKKKSKQEPLPRKFIENESLACVASPYGPIQTPVVSVCEKDILIDRLNKEVAIKFKFTLSPHHSKKNRKVRKDDDASVDEVSSERDKASQVSKKPRVDDGQEIQTDWDDSDETCNHHVSETIKKRLVIGTNACTRALEAACTQTGPRPSLIFLARDVRPPTILAHITIIAKQLGVPILLLPGKASSEMGQALGSKKVAVLLFLPDAKKNIDATSEEPKQVRACHRGIDSFVDFAISKVPLPGIENKGFWWDALTKLMPDSKIVVQYLKQMCSR